MKILIAGLGSIGRRHLRNLLELGERDVILYRTGHSVLPEDELAGFPTFYDLEEALAQRPQAAVIANPTALHLPVAIPAARAGCHLLLEKPLSHTLDGVDELRAALEEGGGQALVGFHFRYHPSLKAIARLLAGNAIGRTLSCRAHWGEYLPGWHPWEDYRQGYSARPELGGGVIHTLSHPLDYLRWLLGDVAALWAFAGSLGPLDLPVEDTAEIGLRFQSGVLGSVHLDYNQQPQSHSLEIIGAYGLMRWDNATDAVMVSRPDGMQIIRTRESFERNTLFLEEMRHFLEVARQAAAPRCTLEDGVQALRLALAAHQSAQQGQLVNLV